MIRRALVVIRAIERSFQFLLVAVDAVRLQNIRRQGLRPGDELSIESASRAAFTDTVLLRGHLAVKPNFVKLT
jgi:hypothetical protein